MKKFLKNAIAVSAAISCLALSAVNVFAASSGYATGDLDGDGEVTSADALMILKKVTGIVDTFPVDEAPAEYTVNITTDDRSKTYKTNSGTTVLTAKLYYPVVKIAANPNAAAAINQTLEHIKVPESYIQDMADIATEEVNNEYFSEYGISVEYETYLNGNILSIVVPCYEYWGGAHGSPYKYAFNFDISTGALITPEMLFNNSYSSFYNYASEYIYNKHSDELMGISNSYGIREYMEYNHWYINENKEFVQYFDVYAIGAFAGGMFDTAIPDADSYYDDYYADILSK